MSIKASWFQIGLSNTANLNFHWRNLLDGVLRLTRGNAGAPITDVMLVNADNSVSFPGNVASGVLGAGQTWQNTTGSRVANTNYTNTTGRPIMVYAALGSATTQVNRIYVDGVIAGQWVCVSTGITSQGAVAIVPNGSVYLVQNNQGAATVQIWSELR